MACLINGQSLMTYIPYLRLVAPISINGMFYALRRTTIHSLGGFEAIERHLCDDFALARAVRARGLKIVQSLMRHPMYTHVPGPAPYLRLIKRWFVFPTVSIASQVAWHELLIFHLFCLVPIALQTGPVALFAWQPGLRTFWPAFLTLILADRVNRYLDRRYLGRPTPRRWFWGMLLGQLLLPLQILWALSTGSEIEWRGECIKANRDGTFQYTSRRRPGG